MADQQINTSNLNSTSSSPISNHAITIKLFGTVMPFDIISASYAILVAAGGIAGYTSKGSVPSLAAGLTFGTLIGAGSYLEAARDNHWLTFASSGVLGAMMLQRFLKSYRFMPAGLISVLSIGVFARESFVTYQKYRERQAVSSIHSQP